MKTYIKPDAERVEFTVQNELANNGFESNTSVGGNTGAGPAVPGWGA